MKELLFFMRKIDEVVVLDGFSRNLTVGLLEQSLLELHNAGETSVVVDFSSVPDHTRKWSYARIVEAAHISAAYVGLPAPANPNLDSFASVRPKSYSSLADALASFARK